MASPTGPRGRSGEAPWPPPPSSSLLASVHPPHTSRILQMAPGGPCPLCLSTPHAPPSRAPHPKRPQHQPQITAQTSMDYRPRRKRPGAWMGRWLISPPPAGAKGQRSQNRGWQPSQLPCLQQLLIQVLQVCHGGGDKRGHKPLITNWFREGKAGEGGSTFHSNLRWKFLLSPGCAQSERRAEREPCVRSHPPVTSSGSLPLQASLSPSVNQGVGLDHL